MATTDPRPIAGYRLLTTHTDPDGTVEVLAPAPVVELARVLRLAQLIANARRFAARAGVDLRDEHPPSRRAA